MFYEGALKFGDDHLATAKSFVNDGIRGAPNLRELNAYANEQYDLEKAREVERLEEFEERLFWIQEELGAKNRMQALRWVVQDDEDAQYDPEYFMYLQGFSIYTNDAARNLLQDIATINKQLARAA